MRLNKAIAASGFCSRRAADVLISEGRVLLNDQPVELGTQVGENDVITVDGKRITETEELIYLAFNKPIGIECITNTSVKKNIVTYLNYPERIFPVGRLDKPSEGLIIMTNDGDIVNKILRARNNHEKEYVVVVDKVITHDFLHQMRNGLPILDTITRKCEVEMIDGKCFRIVLTQGLNRQIRRMCEYCGYRVRKLKRVRIMNIHLGNLQKGEYRSLTKEEFSELNRLIESSRGTEEASL